VEAIENELSAAGLLEKDEGAEKIDFSKHVPGEKGIALGEGLIRKKNGTSSYLIRHIGDLFERYDEKYDFEQMIYVGGSEQEYHISQFFAIVELLGYQELHAKLSQIGFGKVVGMSTSNVKFLDDILDEAKEKMHEIMRKNPSKYKKIEDPEKTADILGISNIWVQDMRGKRQVLLPFSVWAPLLTNVKRKPYHFDIDVMTSCKGDTGSYLQYTYARLCSILRNVSISINFDELDSIDLSPLTEPHTIKLARLILQYPDIVQNTFKTLEPTTVLTYLFRVAHALNNSYYVLKVNGSEKEVMKARCALFGAVGKVLGNGMRLLGLTPLSWFVYLFFQISDFELIVCQDVIEIPDLEGSLSSV
jgi:arginyl-tRNA synthetase